MNGREAASKQKMRLKMTSTGFNTVVSNVKHLLGLGTKYCEM